MAKEKVAIQFKQLVIDPYGDPMKMEDRTKQPTAVLANGQKVYPEKEMYLYEACVQALLYGPGPDKQPPNRDLGDKRYAAACKIAKAKIEGHPGVVTLKPEHVTLTVEAVYAMYSTPAVSAAVYALLEAGEDDVIGKAYADIGKYTPEVAEVPEAPQ